MSPVAALPLDLPTWRGKLHVYAFATAVPAGTLLVLSASGTTATVAAVIYTFSLLALFGMSAAYHRLAHSVKARAVMRRFDHSMIYVLIAGTYTPVCLIALPRAWGIPVLVVVWTGAVAGILVKTIAFDRLPWRIAGNALYLVLGWVALAAIPVMVHSLTGAQLALIGAGGLLYTLGFPVLFLKRPDPWPKTFGYHEVWHAFTVAAGMCHFAAVALLVR